ncbi:hypothetical protein ACVLV4_000718 [Rathayibacter agropyri]
MRWRDALAVLRIAEKVIVEQPHAGGRIADNLPHFGVTALQAWLDRQRCPGGMVGAHAADATQRGRTPRPILAKGGGWASAKDVHPTD